MLVVGPGECYRPGRMNRSPWLWLLLGWVLLQACAGARAPSASSFAYESAGSDGQEAVALGPRFRFSRPAKPPAPSKPSPAAKPPPAQSPAQQKPAAPNPTSRGFLDPKVARSLFDQGMAEAKKCFPHLYGRPKQKHHVHPMYLDGPKDGPTVDLDPAYHQLITNAFREEARYGRRVPPKSEEQQDIMRKVYSRYPLPGIHF